MHKYRYTHIHGCTHTETRTKHTHTHKNYNYHTLHLTHLFVGYKNDLGFIHRAEDTIGSEYQLDLHKYLSNVKKNYISKFDKKIFCKICYI